MYAYTMIFSDYTPRSRSILGVNTEGHYNERTVHRNYKRITHNSKTINDVANIKNLCEFTLGSHSIYPTGYKYK